MGALLSGTVMYLMKRFSKLSIVGVSIIGSIFHSVGQVLVAIVLLNTINMIYYLPWLLLFSIPTGVIVGTISKELVNYFQKELQNN
jgi:heptaprenyl diphosphate synthase